MALELWTFFNGDQKLANSRREFKQRWKLTFVLQNLFFSSSSFFLKRSFSQMERDSMKIMRSIFAPMVTLQWSIRSILWRRQYPFFYMHESWIESGFDVLSISSFCRRGGRTFSCLNAVESGKRLVEPMNPWNTHTKKMKEINKKNVPHFDTRLGRWTFIKYE